MYSAVNSHLNPVIVLSQLQRLSQFIRVALQDICSNVSVRQGTSANRAWMPPWSLTAPSGKALIFGQLMLLSLLPAFVSAGTIPLQRDGCPLAGVFVRLSQLAPCQLGILP